MTPGGSAEARAKSQLFWPARKKWAKVLGIFETSPQILLGLLYPHSIFKSKGQFLRQFGKSQIIVDVVNGHA